MAEILVDDRERKAIFDSFDACKESFPEIKWSVCHSPIGDYVFSIDDKPMFIIERKTYKDMAQSLKDGRKENVKKLLLAREQTGCQLFYILEGTSPFPAPTHKFSGVSFKNIQAHLDHLTLRDGISVLYSRDRTMTARRIFELAHNFMTLKRIPVKSGGAKTQELLKQKFIRGDSEIRQDIWRAIKGIGEKTYVALIAANVTMVDIFNRRIESVADVQLEGGKTIGSKKSKQIISTIIDMPPETWKKMLLRVPSVGKMTAKRLEGISFADIMAAHSSDEKNDELKEEFKDKSVKSNVLAQIIKYVN